MFASNGKSPSHRASPSLSAPLNNQKDDEALHDPLCDIRMEEEVLLSIFNPVAGIEEDMNDIVISKEQASSHQFKLDLANIVASTQPQGAVTQTKLSAGNADPFFGEDLNTREQHTVREPEPSAAKLLLSPDEDLPILPEIDFFSNQTLGTRFPSNFRLDSSQGLDWDVNAEQGEGDGFRISTRDEKYIVGMVQTETATKDEGAPSFMARGQKINGTAAVEASPSHVYGREPLPKLSTNDQLNQSNTDEISLTQQNRTERSVGQFVKLKDGAPEHQKKQLLSDGLLVPKVADCGGELTEEAEQEGITVAPEGSKEEEPTDMFEDLICSLQVDERIAAHCYYTDGHDAFAASLMEICSGESADIINSVYAQSVSVNQTGTINEKGDAKEEKKQNDFARDRSELDVPSGTDGLGVLLNGDRLEDGTLSVSDDRDGRTNGQHQRRQKKKRTRVEDMDPAQVHVCPIGDCQKKFAKKYNLKIHERRHRGDLPFLCPKCSKRFMWQSSFERHLRVHEARAGGCAARSRRMRGGAKGGRGSKRKYYEIEQICNTVSTMMLQGNVVSVNHLDACSVTLAASLGMLNDVAEEEYGRFFEEGFEDVNVCRMNKRWKMSRPEGIGEGGVGNLALAQN